MIFSRGFFKKIRLPFFYIDQIDFLRSPKSLNDHRQIEKKRAKKAFLVTVCEFLKN